jgi:hypothetical protein
LLGARLSNFQDTDVPISNSQPSAVRIVMLLRFLPLFPEFPPPRRLLDAKPETLYKTCIDPNAQVSGFFGIRKIYFIDLDQQWAMLSQSCSEPLLSLGKTYILLEGKSG